MVIAAPQKVDQIRRRRRQDWEDALKILSGQETSLPVLLKSYVDGVGSQADHVVRLVRQKIDDVATLQGVKPAEFSIFDAHARVLPEYLSFFVPSDVGAFFDIGSDERINSFEVFPGSANPNLDEVLPKPINMALHRAMRPGFFIRRLSGSDIRLYVTPFGYQTFSREHNCFWLSASSRTFSRHIATAPILPAADSIVIIQDRFGGDNFAHFLFDFVTRVGLFVESKVDDPRNCLFVMGGICGPFQQILIDALVTIYGIDSSQFFFPDEPVILSPQRQLYWFSDQIDTYTHPAQLGHERSVSILRRVATHIPIAPAGYKRIYITRSDAERRRVANEKALWPALSQRGFEMIRMSDHSVERQLAIVRGAETIVAPHGMGLTPVSLHTGTPHLVELHNPLHGTDAYALMARAMGFPYDYILGEVVDDSRDDFNVHESAIESALDQTRPPRGSFREPEMRKNLLPGSALFSGTWHSMAQGEPSDISHDVPSLRIGNAVMRHVRRKPEQQADTNVGTWWGMRVDPSRMYTASCWIWIPQSFDGEEVALCLGEWPGQSRHMADLLQRDHWQHISASVTTPADAGLANVVLRVRGSDGATVYSTCWQLEAGPAATDYQATP